MEKKKLCSKLCYQLLDESGFDGDFVTQSYLNNHNEITLQLSNAKLDVRFHLKFEETKNDDENSIEFTDNVSVQEYHCPKFEELNHEQLLSIFKSLGQSHAKIVAKSYGKITSEQMANASGFVQDQIELKKLWKLSNSVEENTVDEDVFKEGILKLLEDSKEILKLEHNDLCLNGGIFQRRLFCNDSETDFIILNLQKGNLVSVVYDMLCVVFLITDQKQRQYHFHDITDYYYHVLKQELFHFNININEILSPGLYEKKIKIYIPFVKLQLIHYLSTNQCSKINDIPNSCTLDSLNLNKDYKKSISEAISEVYEYILFPKINREDCFKIVKDEIGTDYDNLKYELIEQQGLLGLIGEYFKLKITATQDCKPIELNLFGKSVPDFTKFVPDSLEGDKTSPILLKEDFFYNTFIPELKNIGLGDITDFLPKCYFVRPGDVMICEDMSSLNYIITNCKEALPYDVCLLVVKQLAKMHACSLLYEEKISKVTGKTFRIDDKFNEYIGEMIYQEGNQFVDAITKCGVDATVNFVFDQFPEVPKEIPMEAFREKSRDIFKTMIPKLRKSKSCRNVICHGDIWAGNILFKFNDATALDCCIIDYQMIRYCPPTHDLLGFLYINTDKKTRTKFMDNFLDAYYNELSMIFARYGFDLNSVYPYKGFIDDCNYMKSHAVCHAALFYPNSLDREKIQQFLTGPEKTMYFFMVDKTDVLQELMKDDGVKARFKEIVEELYSLCLESDS